MERRGEVDEGGGHLAPVAELEGAFAEAAAGDDGDGVGGAAVDLHEGDEALAVFGGEAAAGVFYAEALAAEQGHANAEDLAGTEVAVGDLCFVEEVFEDERGGAHRFDDTAGLRGLAARQDSGAEGAADLLVGLVLAEGVDGPDGGGDPADHGDLEDEADNAGEWASDGEEGEPGQEEGDEQSHGWALGVAAGRSEGSVMTTWDLVTVAVQSPQAGQLRPLRWRTAETRKTLPQEVQQMAALLPYQSSWWPRADLSR